MRFLTLIEVLTLYRQIMQRSGGAVGVRDMGGLESAIAQPRMTFGGQELYPDLADKTAALGFSLINNHPFVDGNKRIGHAAMEVFLMLNGYEFQASVDAQEEIILQVAASDMGRGEFTVWIRTHIVKQIQP